MRTIKVSAVMGCVGLACSAVLGQTALRQGVAISPSWMIYDGQAYPLRPSQGGADVPQVVYDNGIAVPPVNSTTSGAFTTGSLPSNNVMDELSFSPGPGAGQPVLLTSVTFNIATGHGNPSVVTMPFDAIAVRMRIWDTVTPASAIVTSDVRGDVTFIFNAPAIGWEGGFYYVSDPIDLSQLPGGGIQTTDDAIGFGLQYLTTMIDPITLEPVATTTPHPDASVAFADFSGPVTLSVGNSDFTYWRDANADGEFQGTVPGPTEQRQFNPTTVTANFIMSLTGEVGAGPGGCYANCDNSTQEPVLNVADFTCFLQQFAASNPIANCDNSTTEPTLNVADFTCFLQAFAAGCP